MDLPLSPWQAVACPLSGLDRKRGHQQLEPGSETPRDIAGLTSSSVAYD